MLVVGVSHHTVVTAVSHIVVGVSSFVVSTRDLEWFEKPY